MACKVLYTDRKTGKPAESPVFGDPNLAAAYARTVKGGRVVPCDVQAPPVSVTRCDDAEIEDARRMRAAEATLAEHAAEASFEAGSQARLMGASTSEALDVASLARNQVLESESDQDLVCALCARRRPRPGLTTCWTCARRA